MRTTPIRHRLGPALIGGVAALAFSAAPAAAITCPPGTYTGDPLLDYCQSSPVPFATVIAADNPEAWFRLNEATGAQTISDSSGNVYHGGYKNGQSSGPIGISGDNDTARDFWGSSGYAYINGIPAPGFENGYVDYTMEAYFRLEDTDSDVDIHRDATIMQFGGAGAIYVKNNTVRFRNGPNDEVLVPDLFEDNKWYMVVARKSGNNLAVWLRASPAKDTPTPFDPTPDATGSSDYLPGGSPTFYIGYGTWAPWLDGQIDEVSYFTYALTADQIAYHFYADPAPDDAMTRGIPSSGGGSSGGGSGGGSSPAAPAPSGDTAVPTHSGDSSNPGRSQPAAAGSRAAKLTKARAEVKRVNKLVGKARKWVGSLKHNFAPLKAIKRAEKKLKSLQKQLKRAKARVKSLS